MPVVQPPVRYLVVDIETIPDLTVWRTPATSPDAIRPFPPTYAHKVITIGGMWLDANYRMQQFGVISKDGEAATLEQFSRDVEGQAPVLVTYNGRAFDLPVLALRSLHCGVAMGWYYRGDTRHRYNEQGHIDLCDWLADHGAARSSSLDALARLIGLPGKLGIDGSQIEGLYQAGRLQDIENYCLADVAQTALLFLRFRLLQGILSAADYRDAVSELTAQLSADSRVAMLMSAVDGERLLSAA